MFLPPTLECKNWHCPIYRQNESRLLQNGNKMDNLLENFWGLRPKTPDIGTLYIGTGIGPLLELCTLKHP